MASRGCLHPADAFCYVRGHFIKTRTSKYSVKACRKMCKAYFSMPVGDQDKSWAPHFTFEYCKKIFEGKVNNCCLLRCSHSPKRYQPSSGDISKSDSVEDIGDPDYVFTDALRREGHTSLTRKTSTI